MARKTCWKTTRIARNGHSRDPNFQKFLGGMLPDPPRSLRFQRSLLAPAALLTTHMTSISGSQTWGLCSWHWTFHGLNLMRVPCLHMIKRKKKAKKKDSRKKKRYIGRMSNSGQERKHKSSFNTVLKAIVLVSSCKKNISFTVTPGWLTSFFSCSLEPNTGTQKISFLSLVSCVALQFTRQDCSWSKVQIHLWSQDIVVSSIVSCTYD